MPDLLDLLSDGAESGPRPVLDELRLGEDAVQVILFTTDVDEVMLHWEKDPAINRYVVCPGAGCRACYVGTVRKQFVLLPVYSVQDRAVAVLRLSLRVGTNSLRAGLQPFLTDPNISDTVLIIRRNGSNYHVEPRTLRKNADRGEGVIKRYLEARAAGLDLAAVFPQLSVEEYAQVERVRRLTDSLGGPPEDVDDESTDEAPE